MFFTIYYAFSKNFKLVELFIKEKNKKEFFVCCLPFHQLTNHEEDWKNKPSKIISDQRLFCFSLGSHFPSNASLFNIKLWSISWTYMKNSGSKHFLICGHHGWQQRLPTQSLAWWSLSRSTCWSMQVQVHLKAHFLECPEHFNNSCHFLTTDYVLNTVLSYMHHKTFGRQRLSFPC